MGGHVFGIELPRLSTQEALDIIQEVQKQSDFLIKSITWLPSKQDHGDVDFVASTNNIEVQNLADRLHASKIIKNGPIWSLLINQAQVDIINVEEQYIEHAIAYLMYDMGMYLGPIAVYKGLTFALEGLRLRADPDQPWSQDILYESSPEKTFKELGYPWPHPKLLTELDLFQHIMSSPLAKPELFMFENMNAHNRTRNKHRPVYNRFVDWLHEKNMESSTTYSKASSQFALSEHPWLEGQVNQQRTEWAQRKENNWLMGLGAVYYWNKNLTRQEAGEVVRTMHSLCKEIKTIDQARVLAKEILKIQ